MCIRDRLCTSAWRSATENVVHRLRCGEYTRNQNLMVGSWIRYSVFLVDLTLSPNGRSRTRTEVSSSNCSTRERFDCGVQSTLSRVLQLLLDTSVLVRDLPFGESVRSTKKTLYRIQDPTIRFWFRVYSPHRSRW